ncbi:hypothetical protein DSL72_002593 [Monilinia vaccinii-corymbosi]|uniref:Major facilitator superfamily (MFS) profile domain-containing protein n=1 Tax=Monilinia vaccinii-corymbosi TaxID=61207 RepID=A0A8A3PD38_9HELO|nr:hypothetical protein DSL72_002593 [Monilinia vaccinii-corymbosi]
MPSGGMRQCIQDITLYLLLLIFISTLGPLQFGFHLAELNAPQDAITCKKQGVTGPKVDSGLPQCIPMTETEFAALSSLFVIGGLLGALGSGAVSTSYGRLFAMRITSVCFMLGSTLEIFASTVPVMSFGRFIAGIGAGASTVVVPIYISEVAPPRERGLFGSMTQISTNIGILFTQVLGYYLSKGSRWRIILAVGAGLGLLQGIGLLLIPESPIWLASSKSPHKAVKTLQRIRGHGCSIAEEIEDWDIKPTEEEEERLLLAPELTRRDSANSKISSKKSIPNVGFFQVIRDPFYQPAVIAVIGIMFAQQLCGINSIIMYSVSLLSGLLPVSSSVVTILISVVNLVATISCAPLADKIGRKACLLLSITGMGTMSLALALSLRWEIKILSAISVILFVTFFATGLGPVPFIMASEFVGPEAVGATQSVGLAANYVATFIVAQFFPIVNSRLNEALGGVGWVYFIFAALAVLSGIFVSWKVPETRGKKDADEVWGRIRRVD